MFTNKRVSTTSRINSKGGETNTYIRQGSLIGGLLGAALGVVLAMVNIRGEIFFVSLAEISPVMIFAFIVLSLTFFMAAAGAVVGMGVPRVKRLPDQGPVKKWRSVSTENQGRENVIFVPELERNNLRNPLQWNRREPEVIAEASNPEIIEKGTQEYVPDRES